MLRIGGTEELGPKGGGGGKVLGERAASLSTSGLEERCKLPSMVRSEAGVISQNASGSSNYCLASIQVRW